MLDANSVRLDMIIQENRCLKPDEHYEFTYEIENVIIDNVRYMTQIISVEILLDEFKYFFNLNSKLPCSLSGSLVLPQKIGSWYPVVVINGIDQYGFPHQVPFLYVRPIITTPFAPILDARLGRSNWTSDELKVNQIKQMLNIHGFDCTTIGKEIQAPINRGDDFIKFEKEWASGGHCFIAILTPRDISSYGGLSLPPPWVLTESGLSYESDRPHLVFAEKGVDLVALYQEMNNDHIIGFEMIDGKIYYENDYARKVSLFRTESEGYELKKKITSAGQLVFIGFAVYGGYKLYTDLFDSESKRKK